jgi:hypothetical protein
VIEGLLSRRESMVEGTDVVFFLANNPGEPIKFHETYNHPEPDARVMWRVAIFKDFEDKKKRGVWEVISKEKMSDERRYAKINCVFKIKRNGIFRAGLVACGYSQVPGIDLTESYTSVIDDVSFRIIFIGMMVWNLKSKIIDIETAFFHGDFEERIFIEIPSGMEVGDSKCLVLKTKIYRLVQITAQFYLKLVKALKSCGITGSLVDPCLWVKQSNTGIVMIEI